MCPNNDLSIWQEGENTSWSLSLLALEAPWKSKFKENRMNTHSYPNGSPWQVFICGLTTVTVSKSCVIPILCQCWDKAYSLKTKQAFFYLLKFINPIVFHGELHKRLGLTVFSFLGPQGLHVVKRSGNVPQQYISCWMFMSMNDAVTG